VEIVVRPLEPADAAGLAAAVAASLDHLRPWMPWAADEPRPPAWHRARIVTGAREEAAGGDRLRGIFVGDAVVGGCGLHRRVGPDGLEIGYWVHAAWTRRGIATAAVRQLTAEGLADPAIAFVEIHHDPANVASGAVAAAAGFTKVAGAPGAIWRLSR